MQLIQIVNYSPFLILIIFIILIAPIFSSSGGIIWSLINLLSNVPTAFSYVISERYFSQQVDRADRDIFFDFLSLNCWSNLYLIVCVSAFFWVDFIPVVGFSNSITDFGENFRATTRCFFLPSICPDSL